MPKYSDTGHRPHAIHTGEPPTTGIDRGPHGLKVTLDTWGPRDAWGHIWRYLQSNWGDTPALVEDPRRLTPDQSEYVTKCLHGNTLQQVLEGLTFWFTIDGVCRPATHQIVRTRGAAFMQHGGRDNDWRHRRFSMPETISRMCGADHAAATSTDPWARNHDSPEGLKHCITNWEPIDKLILQDGGQEGIVAIIEEHIARSKEIYAALVDAGIPWQDARRLLPMGLQTYIHGIYDWLTLKSTLANRLEFIMDWEYNCVAQLMHRELYIHVPFLAKFIESHSDKSKTAEFAGLESWSPDGKYPNPYASDHHTDMLQRAHRPEQNPFWVLTPDALHGEPVEWIPTNGVYPHDIIDRLEDGRRQRQHKVVK